MVFWNLVFLSVVAITHGKVTNHFGSRIVNGKNATIEEVPFLVSIQIIALKSHECGGVILNPNYVLTAAHCTYRRKAGNFRIVAGSTDLKDPTVSRGVIETYVHEDFDMRNFLKNDISILKVDRPFEFTKTVIFSKLANSDDVYDKGMAMVFGWGRTDLRKPTSRFLQKVNTSLISNEYCSELYKKKKMVIHNEHICTFESSWLRGTCKGDSGGPLIVDGIVVGLVSWSITGCANLDYPSVYTRISNYIDWIHKHSQH